MIYFLRFGGLVPLAWESSLLVLASCYGASASFETNKENLAA